MQKRYWLRGGVIGILIPSLALFIPIGSLVIAPLRVLTHPVLYAFHYYFGITSNPFIPLVMVFVFYFIVGAILGWLYGKFKNRSLPKS